MSGIGPELPPHLLAKRKRQQEESVRNEPTTTPGAKPSASPEDGEKRRRLMGPVMPPAPLDERPIAPPNATEESDSDDEDGFGPALPAGDENGAADEAKRSTTESQTAPVEEKPRRDEWMTMPPKQDDLAARMDPSKQRARGFNTGKGARGANTADDDNSAWHETPEQKQKRLADELMGVSKPSSTTVPSKRPDTSRDEAAAKRIREATEKVRGPSLIDQHQKGKGADVEEDDPSKRAFDKEKDMASGKHVGHAQRKEMLNRASGFSSKFTSGSYL